MPGHCLDLNLRLLCSKQVVARQSLLVGIYFSDSMNVKKLLWGGEELAQVSNKLLVTGVLAINIIISIDGRVCFILIEVLMDGRSL